MKKFLTLFLFTLLITGLSFGMEKGILRGRVSDQEGKPLADVRVEVDNTSIETVTLVDGTFVLESLTPGKYKLIFTHPDYMPGMLEVNVSEKPTQWLRVDLYEKNPKLLTIREEITVTAQADSLIDVSLPSHRTIITSRVLTELGTANIAETVEKAPGVTMAGKGGYSMVPAIRGLAEHRILLLVDGIRITTERRIGASASFININDIDRIEVNRGPYSVFYGSGAVGGIINIITKSPSANEPFQGNVLLGYNTVREEKAASLNLSGSLGQYGFLLSASGKKASDYSSPKGIIEQSHYSDYDLIFKMNREWKNSNFYVTFLNYQGVDIGKPSPSSKFKPRWYPKERNTIFSMGYKMRNKFQLDSLSANFYVFPSLLETQKENLDESLRLEKRSWSKVDGTNFGFKIRGGKTLAIGHTLNFGLDYFGRHGGNDLQVESSFDELGQVSSKTESTSIKSARSNNFGLYVDDKIRISSLLTMNAGVRFDYISSSNLTDSDSRVSKKDQSLTAYVGSIFQVTPRFSLLANVGRSFRFPTISELFYTGLTGRGIVFGNPDLKPEQSLNIDFGLRYLHGNYFASIYVFRNVVTDMIQKYSGESEDEYYYKNLSKGRIMGIEGEFYFWWIKNCEIFMNFHHMVGEEQGTNVSLNYIPPTRVTLGAKFNQGKFWMEPKMIFTSAKKDPGPLEIETEAYSLFNTNLGFRVNSNIMLLVIAQNILNQTYRLSADEKGVDAPGRGIVFKVSWLF